MAKNPATRLAALGLLSLGALVAVLAWASFDVFESSSASPATVAKRLEPTASPTTSDTPQPTEIPPASPTSTVDDAGIPPYVAPQPAGVDMAALREELEPLISSWAGENAVTITDLQTGESLSINGDRREIGASTVKLFIVMLTAQDVEAGRYSADSVYWSVYNTMAMSDNTAARELIWLAGDRDVDAGLLRIHDFMLDLGMTQSVIRHAPGYMWEPSSLGDGSNILTTDEINLALAKLYRGEALSPWATAYVLRSMTLAPEFYNGSIGGPLPDDTVLYHKVGWVDGVESTWNDAGIVTFERDGRRYAYAISYLGSYGGHYMDAYRHASELSDIAWQAFDAAYTVP